MIESIGVFTYDWCMTTTLLCGNHMKTAQDYQWFVIDKIEVICECDHVNQTRYRRHLYITAALPIQNSHVNLCNIYQKSSNILKSIITDSRFRGNDGKRMQYYTS